MSRLHELSIRYTGTDSEPDGEAFYRAFARYIKSNRESLFDIALTASTAEIFLDSDSSVINPRLLEAITATNPSLTQDSLFSLDADALQGAINTAKGKYFEYLVVDRLNAGEQVGPVVLPDGYRAELAESMTQPGWDLRIVDGDGIAAEFLQLKATDSIGYIQHALSRYPDIQILATEEVGSSGLVLDSGIAEADLREQVAGAVDQLDESVLEQFLDYFSPLLPLVAIASWEGYKVSLGQQSLDEFKLAIARRGQRIVATNFVGAAVYALDGGVLTVPAAIMGGLIFDRTINQTAIMASYKQHADRMLAFRLEQQGREISSEAAWGF